MGKQSRDKREKREMVEPGVVGSQAGLPRVRTGSGRVLEKICLFVITWGTYLVLFTPLVINTDFFFPFVAPKTVFFRMVIEIILVAYLFLVIVNRNYRPRINALSITIAVFMGIFVLASFTGVNLERSFWSTNERMTGILTMLHLFTFFIVLSSVFKERKDWERALGVSVIVGAILSIYVLMGSEISTRGGGTIGNTSFMAAYLLFNVFFALILFFSNFLKKESSPPLWQTWSGVGFAFVIAACVIAKLFFLIPNWLFWLASVLIVMIMALVLLFGKRISSLFWQIFAGSSLLIMIPVLLNSTGRGAIAAFFGGLFLLGLGYLFFSQKRILKRSAWAIVLVLMILGMAAAIFQPSFVTDEAGATLKEMKSRVVVWENGWKGFLERPILGWGPENFIVVFSKYFNPCMFLSECGTEIWFDRAHNVVFDTLVTTGIVGFLSYLGIFIAAIYGLLRMASKIVDRRNIFFPLGLIVILLSYFFQNLLVFDMINTYLMFFLTLAFINFFIQNQKQPAEEERAITKPLNPILASVIVMATVFVFWTVNIEPLRANAYVIKMVNSQEVNESSLFFQKSLGSWMEKYETREQFTQKIYKAGYQPIPEENKESFQKVFNLAQVEMEKGIKQNYLDFRPHLFLGQLYISSYRLSGKEEEIVRAEQVLEEAIRLSPTNQQGYWNLAEAKLAQGKIGETISLLQKAIDLEPRFGYSHWYLALAYQINGDYQQAIAEVKKAQKNGYNWPADPQSTERVIDIINSLGGDTLKFLAEDDREMIEYCLKLLKVNPGNMPQHVIWSYLAASYANLGQFDEARQSAQKVIELNPDLAPKVQEFLKSLPR
ncbi:MAG: O-antigen ligase family protein [Candidatus Nealsonbacteria bacterium]